MSAEIAEALDDAGLRLAGPLGRTHDGFRWSVVDDGGGRWAMTVRTEPAAAEAEGVRRRVAALGTVEHPHLACPGPLLDLGPHGLIVLQEEVDGADLVTVRAARGPWSPGEVVTLVVPLAQALAALHDVGLAHGDVSPANVVVTRDGLPVLVDLVHGADPTEVGTPGYAAPERRSGADPASDVYALGRMGLALTDACDDDPRRARLRDALTGAVDPDPCARPTAAELAHQVYRACDPEPVALPEPAVLTRHALQRLAGDQEVPTRRSGAAQGRRRGRHRRASRRPRMLLGAVAVVLVAAGALVTGNLPEAAVGADGPGGAPVAGDRVVLPSAVDGPVTAAVRLTVMRAEALAGRNPRALAAVTVPGSPAARTDAEALARLAVAEHGDLVARVRFDAVGRCVPDRRLPDLPAAPPCPECVRVLVRARSHAVPATTADDGRAIDAGESADRDAEPGTVSDIVLVLDRTGGRWRVSAVESACP